MAHRKLTVEKIAKEAERLPPEEYERLLKLLQENFIQKVIKGQEKPKQKEKFAIWKGEVFGPHPLSRRSIYEDI